MLVSPWQLAALAVICMAAHAKDYFMTQMRAQGSNGQLLVISGIGAGLILHLVSMRTHHARLRAWCSDVVSLVPVLCAVFLQLTGMPVESGDTKDLIRHMICFMMVTIGYQLTTVDATVWRQITFVGGHALLIPHIVAPDSVPALYKTGGFALALALGVAIPRWLQARGSTRVRPPTPPTPLSLHAAAELKGRILALEHELSDKATTLTELRATCNSMIRAYKAAKDDVDTLVECVQHSVPVPLWPPAVRAIIEHDDAEAGPPPAQPPQLQDHALPYAHGRPAGRPAAAARPRVAMHAEEVPPDEAPDERPMGRERTSPARRRPDPHGVALVSASRSVLARD